MQAGLGPVLKHILTTKLISSSWINNFSTFQSFPVKSTRGEIVLLWNLSQIHIFTSVSKFVNEKFQNWAEVFSRDFLKSICGSRQCVNNVTGNTNWNQVPYFCGNSRWLRGKSQMYFLELVWYNVQNSLRCNMKAQNATILHSVFREERKEKEWYQFLQCPSYQPFFIKILSRCYVLSLYVQDFHWNFKRKFDYLSI